MPLYNTATAAAAIEVSPKWLDNLLSHNDIADIQIQSQGVARRLSLSAITQLLLVKQLIDTLNLPSPCAIRLAESLLSSSSGEVPLSPLLHLSLRPDAFRADVLARLARAVEAAPTPRRGRPPKR